MTRKFILSAIILATMLSASKTAHAADAKLNVEIPVSFKNVPVGALYETVQLSGDNYSISGKAKSGKLVSVIAKSRGDFSSQGKITGRSVKPIGQKVSYRNGKKKSRSTMTFAGSNVASHSAKPKVKYKKGAIPVTAAHLKNVIDPVSSLVFPIGKNETASGATVCNRTLQIFDGKNRMELRFRFKRETRGKAAGYSGTVYTCGVRFKPVAGHRPGSKSTRFMQAQTGMEIQLAQVGSTNVYSLYGFNVPTRYGVARGTASKFIAR